MAKNSKVVKDENFELVEGALSKTERYIEENQKSLTIIVVAIILIAIFYLGFTKLYIAPKEKDAQSEIFTAEQYFETDSFRLALDGDENAFGFLYIIDEYGVTKTGNLACYYAGICYLHLGEYENAIEYLKKFDADDEMISPMAYGAIGDASAELEDYDEAESFYSKAVDYDNNFSTPMYLMKLGILYEKKGENEKALNAYQRIKDDYKASTEARYIDKYIERTKS